MADINVNGQYGPKHYNFVTSAYPLTAFRKLQTTRSLPLGPGSYFRVEYAHVNIEVAPQDAKIITNGRTILTRMGNRRDSLLGAATAYLQCRAGWHRLALFRSRISGIEGDVDRQSFAFDFPARSSRQCRLLRGLRS
jgi:hypothetical protein